MPDLCRSGSEVRALGVASFVWRLNGVVAVGGRMVKADVCVVFSPIFVSEFDLGLKKEVALKAEAVVELEILDDVFWVSVDDPFGVEFEAGKKADVF